MTLNKLDLINILAERIGLNRREAKDMVEAFFEEMSAALERSETVKLPGFGNFQVRRKPQRPGRNPKTREPAVVTARRVVIFRVSRKVKTRLEKLARGSSR